MGSLICSRSHQLYKCTIIFVYNTFETAWEIFVKCARMMTHEPNGYNFSMMIIRIYIKDFDGTALEILWGKHITSLDQAVAYACCFDSTVVFRKLLSNLYEKRLFRDMKFNGYSTKTSYILYSFRAVSKMDTQRPPNNNCIISNKIVHFFVWYKILWYIVFNRIQELCCNLNIYSA